MRKIAISLTKGGVGKTTTAVNLSAGLACRGFKTLLVDADTQCHASSAFGIRTEQGLADVIAENIPLKDAIIEARPNLHLLAGGRLLSGVRRSLNKKEFGGENTLAEILQPLEKKYDFILLDTSPGLDILCINVLFYAEELLTPVSLEVLSLQSLVEFQQIIQSIQKYHKIELKYVLPTFSDGRVKKSSEILEQLIHYYADLVCDPIRYSVKLSESPGFGQTIFEYSPRSRGADDFQKLTERISANGT